MPYKRPMTGKGLFKKYEYVYDEYYDCYICPNNEVLFYSTNRQKMDINSINRTLNKCVDCPLREQCTRSKKCQKIITSHIWEEYKEQTNENRYTQNWKDQLSAKEKKLLKELLVIVKNNQWLRFTRIRGLLKNEQNTTMIFACHNLKKMALWRWKTSPIKSLIKQIIAKILKFTKKEAYSILNIPLCQQSESMY